MYTVLHAHAVVDIHTHKALTKTTTTTATATTTPNNNQQCQNKIGPNSVKTCNTTSAKFGLAKFGRDPQAGQIWLAPGLSKKVCFVFISLVKTILHGSQPQVCFGSPTGCVADDLARSTATVRVMRHEKVFVSVSFASL